MSTAPHPEAPGALLAVEALFERFSGSGVLIGLDLGTRTLGVAASDPSWRIATPVETIRRRRFAEDAARLAALADARGAVAYVIGLPFNMDGTAGPRVQATRAFARNLAALDPRPVAGWDERLSTAAVERALIAADTSRARRAELIDSAAAAYILQGALDRLRRLAEGPPPRTRDD